MLKDTLKHHYAAIEKTFKLLKDTGLTLNGPKCILSQDILSGGCGLLIKASKPGPEKCKAFQEMEPPKRKEDVPSFLSMLQSHAKFIPMFSKLTSNIQALQKRNARFRWTDIHQQEFNTIKEYFRDSTTLFLTQKSLPGFLWMQLKKVQMQLLHKEMI